MNRVSPVCLALAGAFALIGLVPRWRKAWRWGNDGSAAPISGVGYGAICGAFLLLGGGAGFAPDPWRWMAPLAGFVLFIAGAVFDSIRHGRKRR